MRKFRLENMKSGWFIGEFSQTCCKTGEFEVLVNIIKKVMWRKARSQEDTVTVVVKVPSIMGDKYFVREHLKG